jgi:hypothetical protein
MCCCRAAQVAALNPDTEYECIGHAMQMRADLPLTVRRHCQLGRAAHAWSLGPLGPVVTAINFARAAEASVVVSAPRMGVHSEYGFCLDVALPGALGRGEVLMYAPRRWSRRPPHPTALYVAAGLIGLICLYLAAALTAANPVIRGFTAITALLAILLAIWRGMHDAKRRRNAR